MSRNIDKEAFNKAIEYDELTKEKETLENIDRQDPDQIDNKYRNLPQVLDKLKSLDDYFDRIDDAIRYGFIALDDLRVVLAKDESYREFLPKLWTKYQCDLRGQKEPDAATVGDRQRAWQNLLHRWAFGIVAGVSSGLKPVPPLPTHHFDQETGDLKKYDRMVLSGHVPVVKLDDLRRYFTETIGIPLPTRLFPVQGYENSISTKLSPRENDDIDQAPNNKVSGRKTESAKMTHHRPGDYQHLDLPELKVMAEGWADRFSVIKQITLYRANRDGKYVLDVRIDDSDKIEYRYFKEYWIDKACYLDRLRDVYKTPDTDYYRDWLFRLPEVGGEPLSKDDQVLTDSRFVLFPRDDVDAGNKSILGTMSQAEHFPHLLKKQLELYALDWVTKYHDVPIKSIVLYTYISQYEKYSKVPINVQYAVVFEIDETEENEPSWRLNEAELAEYHRKQITGKIPATPYEKLLADTHATMGDDAAIVRPAAFKNVYRQSPSGHYKGEWRFILKFLKTELPKGVKINRPCWILFSPKQVDVDEADLPELQRHANVFHLCGDIWNVKYKGNETSLRNLERVRYVVCLLKNPAKGFYPIELTRLVKGNSPNTNKDYSTMGEDQLEEEGISLADLPLEKLSKDDKSKLENITYKCWEALNKAKKLNNEKQIKEEEKRWDSARSLLLNEYGVKVIVTSTGLNFKFLNRLKDDQEKARSNVTKHIKHAISDIKKKLPSLGKHLDKHIKTGLKCSYGVDPETLPIWDIRENN